MSIRFSLRALFLLTALVAAACWWWTARPTIVAQRFVAAIDRGDYASAENLAVDEPTKSTFQRLFGILERLQDLANDPSAQNRLKGQISPTLKVRLLPRSWRDIWRAERRIILQADGDKGLVRLAFGKMLDSLANPLIAHHDGVELIVEIVPLGPKQIEPRGPYY